MVKKIIIFNLQKTWNKDSISEGLKGYELRATLMGDWHRLNP